MLLADYDTLFNASKSLLFFLFFLGGGCAGGGGGEHTFTFVPVFVFIDSLSAYSEFMV